jgi:hypothetical protein
MAADAQDGVLRRSQLRELGVSDDVIRGQVAAGRWRLAARGVVVLHNGPLTSRQRCWVAVLAQSNGALAGLTAARDQGLSGFDDDVIDVVIGHSARPHRLPGVRIHLSRRFDVDDIHPARRIPTVRIERALVDGAAWTAAPRKACAVIAAGVQQRLTTAKRLGSELAEAPRARHHRLLAHVLADIEGGAESFGEIDFGRIVRLAGLPPPRRQVFRYDRSGRRRWLDADLDGFSVEIDGAIHLRPLRYWDDMERQNDLVIVTGRPILRFSTVAFRIAEASVVAQLAAAAARFGMR